MPLAAARPSFDDSGYRFGSKASVRFGGAVERFRGDYVSTVRGQKRYAKWGEMENISRRKISGLDRKRRSQQQNAMAVAVQCNSMPN
jgi:hypothetical protein